MRTAAALLALAALLPVAPAAGAPEEATEAEWPLLRNEPGTLSLRVPPGWRERPSANAAVSLSVEYKEPPYLGTSVSVTSYAWTKPPAQFLNLVQAEVGNGKAVAVEGSSTRFRMDTKSGEHEYVFLVDLYAEGGHSHYVRIACTKAVFEDRLADWMRVLDSARAEAPPAEGFQVPEGWTASRPTLMFRVLAPVSGVADAKERAKFEGRVAQVNSWLLAGEPRMRMVRTLVGDDRQWMPRRPVHLLATAEAFRAACGDLAAEGRGAVYLPDHPERPVVVDGSRDPAVPQDEVCAAAALSYLEGRLGRLPAWMRPALETYLRNAFEREVRPGAVSGATLARVAPAMAKNPPSFEAILKMDDAALRALDPAAGLVPWVYLQYGLHGPDENLRKVFQEFLRAEPGAADAGPAWEKALEGFKERTKKPFRPKDLDGAARDWLKGLAAAPPPVETGWPLIRNDMGTLEFRLPPGWVERPNVNPNIVVSVEYKDGAYKGSVVLACTYDYRKDFGSKDEAFAKFVESDVGGKAEYEDGSVTRFRVEKAGDLVTYVYLVDRVLGGNSASYLRIASPKDVYEAAKGDWTRVLDSLKARPAPEDVYKVPPAWQAMKPTLLYHVMGPSRDVEDPKERKKFEGRLFQVSSWLDESDARQVMVKEIGADQRKWVSRRAVHVFPTADAFKAACGDAWRPGLSAAYLADHPERIVVLDGSPESAITQDEAASVAALAYLEGRYGRLPPWMRCGFRTYVLSGIRRNCKPGLFPPETIHAAAAAFGKNPPSFEAVLKMDEAAVRGLDEAGQSVLWGYLYYGLHGPDAAVRELFRGFLRAAEGSEDSAAAWEGALAKFKEQAKKPFKPKDLDAPAKKLMKDLARAERK